jgi:hypothetical protein
MKKAAPESKERLIQSAIFRALILIVGQEWSCYRAFAFILPLIRFSRFGQQALILEETNSHADSHYPSKTRRIGLLSVRCVFGNAFL